MKINNDKTRILINSAIVTFATVIDKFIFFIINIIVARYLNIEHYGEFTTALGYATFFSSLSNIGITFTLIRAINIEAGRDSENFGNSLFLKTVIAIITYTVMTASLYFTNYNSNTILLILIFGLVRVGNEYMITFYALYEAKEKFLRPSIFNLSFSLSLLTGTILVVLYNGNYFDLVKIRLANVIIFISILSFFTLRKLKLSLKVSSLKKFLISAIPFGLWAFMSTFLTRINIIILSLMHGTVYSGIFNNGYIFFMTILFIPGSFVKVLTPFLYKALSENDKNKFQFAYDVFSKFFAVVSFFILLLLFLYADSLVISIFSTKYHDSINVLKIVSFAIPPVFNLPATIITALDKQKYNTIFTFVGMIVNIICNLVLIYYYKAEGAAISLVITYILIFTMCNAYLFKNRLVSIKNGNIVYILTILITITCIFIENKFLGNVFWVYSLIIITLIYLLLVFLFIIKKDDIRIIKETLGIKK
jgi:O-antigen/teichoic acid export membrane protein